VEHFGSEGTIGLIVLMSIALGSALVWHCLMAFYVRAVIGATITTVIAFQVAAYFHLGYLDSFFSVAAITSALYMKGRVSLILLLAASELGEADQGLQCA
jgi:hypothetical protein